MIPAETTIDLSKTGLFLRRFSSSVEIIIRETNEPTPKGKP